MLRAVCTFVALLLAALLVGTTFAHTLEMSAKLSFSGPQWVHLQQSLYREFATVGGAIEIAAIFSASFYAYLLRKERSALRLAATGAAMLAIAFTAWIFMTEPVNAEVLHWNPGAIPAGWETLRTRWEYSHAIRFVLQLVGLSALLGSALTHRSQSL